MDVSPLLVFSPHLDDAVLSLGNLIASHPGSIVVTVLAGMPADQTMTTKWDRSCGFGNAGDSMRARRQEDDAALAMLAATSIHLDHLDRQYGVADPNELADAIAGIIVEHADRPMYGPLGVWHPDHRRVSDAFLDAVATTAIDECWLYADIPHYAQAGGLERRLAELGGRDVAIGELVAGASSTEAKARASDCYVSQMVGLGTMPLDLPELTAAVRCTSRR